MSVPFSVPAESVSRVVCEIKSTYRFALLICVLVLCPLAIAQVTFYQNSLTFSGPYPNGYVYTADFNGDGKPDLVTSTGGILLNNGDGTFTAGTSLSLPSGASVFAAGDFNGDGKADVLVVNGYSVETYLGNGDGTFQSPVSTYLGFQLYPYFATVADVNGDGKLDILANNGSLMVFLGKEDGTFSLVTQQSAFADSQTRLVIGDFNGDGKPDAATIALNASGTSYTIFVALGNGDGTFQSPQTTAFLGSTVNDTVQAFAAAQFYGDGKLDLVILLTNDQSNQNSVSTLQGNGDGTFQAPSSPTEVMGSILTLTLGDLNNDGNLDVVITGGGPFCQVLLNDGNGNFSGGQEYFFTTSSLSNSQFSSSGYNAIVADFNGDGKADVVMAGGAVLLGNGDGTLQTAPALLAGITIEPAGSGFLMTSGDFNNDGYPDLAVVTGSNSGNGMSLNIELGNGKGDFTLANTYLSPGTYPFTTIVTGDVNGDGKPDLIFSSVGWSSSSSSYPWTITSLLGGGDGSFGSPINTTASNNAAQDPQIVALGDFNGDHKLDIAAIFLDQYADSVYTLLGNGDGTFAAAQSFFAGSGTNSVGVGDFNGDGKLDVVVASQAGVAVLLGNGDGTLQAPTFISTTAASGVTVADVNGDGNLDLITPGTVFLGKGDGTFTTLASPNAGPGFVADFKGDGRPDLQTTVGAGQHSEAVIVLGNGDGTFSNPIVLGTTSSAGYFDVGAVADFNVDGRPDLAVVINDASIGILLNTTPPPTPGFNVAGSNLSPATITPGGSANSKLTLSPANGFSGTVNLTCAVTPSSTRAPLCTISPSSVQVSGGSAGASLTIATSGSPATASGSYVAAVTATSGTLTHQIQLTFTVQPAPDFQVSSTPLSPTSVAPGASATSTFTITAMNGFTGTVNLGCSVTPVVTEGPTCTLNPSSLPVSGSTGVTSTLTVSTTGPTTTGRNRPFGLSLGKMALASLLFVFVVLPGRTRHNTWPVAMLCFIVILGLGCGGGSSHSKTTTPGTPAGTYTITVTGASASLSHPVQVSFAVQ